MLKILEESCERGTSPGILSRNCSHVTCRAGDQADSMRSTQKARVLPVQMPLSPLCCPEAPTAPLLKRLLQPPTLRVASLFQFLNWDCPPRRGARGPALARCSTNAGWVERNLDPDTNAPAAASLALLADVCAPTWLLGLCVCTGVSLPWASEPPCRASRPRLMKCFSQEWRGLQACTASSGPVPCRGGW